MFINTLKHLYMEEGSTLIVGAQVLALVTHVWLELHSSLHDINVLYSCFSTCELLGHVWLVLYWMACIDYIWYIGMKVVRSSCLTEGHHVDSMDRRRWHRINGPKVVSLSLWTECRNTESSRNARILMCS